MHEDRQCGQYGCKLRPALIQYRPARQVRFHPRRKVPQVTTAPDKAPEEVRRFIEGMTSEERMLVVLKRELYEGSWDEMIADLQARLEGRPYMFKLAHRISDDLARIERLSEFEQRSGEDLGKYIDV